MKPVDRRRRQISLTPLVGPVIALPAPSPAQLAAMVREDLARWAPVVKASGAQVD